jgi:hypothetical protein
MTVHFGSNEWNYYSPTVIGNITIDGFVAAVGDTCEYGGSGDWNINMSDLCIINTAYNVSGMVNFTVNALPGNCTFNSSLNMTDMGDPPADTILWMDSNARVYNY